MANALTDKEHALTESGTGGLPTTSRWARSTSITTRC